MIITDSLGAPRKQAGKTLLFIETWPYQVKLNMQKVLNYENFIYTQQGLSTRELISDLNLKLDLYDNEYIFMHIGIVDCARRVLSFPITKIISSIPGIRSVIKWVSSKYHYKLTKLYKITYTSPKKFYSNLNAFLQSFPNAKIYLIPILPVGDKMKKVSYGIDEQIKLYNSIIEKLSANYNNVIYLKEIISSFIPTVEPYYFADGYHLTEKAHKIIYDSIVNGVFQNQKNK